MVQVIIRFLSLARSKLKLCSANHRPGYWSNLPCDWPSTAWAYPKQEIENVPWCPQTACHYLGQYWLRFIPPCSISSPWWVMCGSVKYDASRIGHNLKWYYYHNCCSSGMGVLELCSLIFPFSKILFFVNIQSKSFESRSYLTNVGATALWPRLSNMNVIFNS